MELPRKLVRDALVKVNKVIPRNASFDWLTCVFVDVTPESVKFKGTDGDVSISIDIATGSNESEQFLIDAHALKRVIDKGPKSETVTFGEQVLLGNIPFNIRQENPDEFRIDMLGDEAFNFTVSGRAFDILSDAMSEDVKRPYLQGVFADVRGLKLVSTNGERMYFYDVQEVTGDCEGIIIPAKAVLTLAKLSKGCDVTVFGNERAASFSFDNVKVTAKNVDGAFPNWLAVFDKKNGCSTFITLETQDLAPLVDALSASHAFMDLNVDGGKVSVGGYVVPASVTGDGVYARVQTNYFANLLAKSTRIEIGFPPVHGAVFAKSGDCPNWDAAVMPSSKEGV